MIIIRRAEQADVLPLIRLLRRSWLVTWAPELPFEAVQAFAAADPARDHVQSDWREFTVAKREGELLGMVQTNDEFIQALHVDPACWNCGVGSSLLNEAEQKIARSFAIARLEVRSFNSRARAFYARHRWTEVRQYQGMECGSPVENIEMQKRL